MLKLGKSFCPAIFSDFRLICKSNDRAQVQSVKITQQDCSNP